MASSVYTDINNTELDPSNAPISGEITFGNLGLNDTLASHLIDKMRFRDPTAIQQKTIPAMISENPTDMVVQAQTGSGKTLAYVLPIIQKLMTVEEKVTRDSGLFAIIIVPTRELATQIYSVLESLVRCCHYIVPGIVIGGEKKKAEKARLRKGVNILVGTPGRLADHLDNTEALRTSFVRWVIMDEGDRLLELGFEETISKIMAKIQESSQIRSNRIKGLPDRLVTILCSATLKEEVRNLEKQFLSNTLYLSVEQANADLDNSQQKVTDADNNDFWVPDQLHQEFVVVPMKLRLVMLVGTLLNIMKTDDQSKIIVFLSCSDSVNFYFSMLTREISKLDMNEENEDDWNEGDLQRGDKTYGPSEVLSMYLKNKKPHIYKLHGSLLQKSRKDTLQSFSSSTSEHSILLCTDVASRGLDLPQISHVLEFDPPFAVEDHIHRVGRTARLGEKGWSIMFVLPGKEEKYIKDEIEPIHKSMLIQRDYSHILSSAFGSKFSWQDIVTNVQLDVERWLLRDSIALKLAEAAFTSHVRAYATHLVAERQYFNRKDLHLGHLAKSFALRNTPVALGRHISDRERQNGSNHEKKRRSATEEGPDYAKKRLLKIAQLHANVGADEFNLG
ncbi:P-loop containing nucleoside triphosphate hydrolase protein [Dipodascopsis uninucleata]